MPDDDPARTRSLKMIDRSQRRETDDAIPKQDGAGATSRFRRLCQRFSITQNEKMRWLLSKKPVGRDGPGGHWYIRVPLWLQSTFLIFFIGFISIVILVAISAVQVWAYTETLMQHRLSSLAAMTAIELEQTFHSLRSLTTPTSPSSVIRLLEASNSNGSTVEYWSSFSREVAAQMSFSDCLALEVYDKYMRPIYTYRKRASSGNLFGQQSDFIPRTLLPLSDPNLRSDMLQNLNQYLGGIVANTSINQVSGPSRSVNLTYSVSVGVSINSDLNGFDETSSQRTNYEIHGDPKWIGYVTYVLKNPVSAAVLNEQLFSRYILEIVRLNDIDLGSTPDESLKSGKFAFLYPFISENGTVDYRQEWPISAFPVLIDAINLLRKVTLATVGSLNSTGHNALNKTSKSSFGEGSSQQIADGVLQADGNIGRRSLEGQNSTSLNDSTTVTNSSNSQTNEGLGNTSSIANFTRGEEELSLVKTDWATMRTKTPFDPKSSVGYSFADIYDQKWLVFVQIPSSEAFIDASNLRDVVLGVGAGILGAVFLILLPLSRWQTRGFYVIYRNMRLRPMFVYDENSKDAEENNVAQTAEDISETPTNNSEWKSSTEMSKCKTDDSKASENDISTQKQYETDDLKKSGNYSKEYELSVHSHGADTLDDSGSVKRQHDKTLSRNSQALSEGHSALSPAGSTEQYKLNIPKPLPPLNRWYKDEVDDLIQEYNNMTEKLNAHYLHLEDQVRLRTREVQKARELREQANVAKSEFIAIISHELRTPLNGIMGLTAVSVDEPDISKIRSALKIIIDSGHILMDLLNELLELSKSLVGVDPVVYEFTPSTLLEMLPNMFSSRAPSLSVTFGMAAVPQAINNLRLKGDVDHIAQVCLNFMSNAMKFSEKNGNVSVIVYIRPYNDPLVSTDPYGGELKNANGILEILVTDSGVGISQQQLARIFDLFVQGEDPLRKNRKGAGLGMALSKQLAEGIGGYVAVFSAKDVGTTTLIRAPIEVMNHTLDEVAALSGPPIEFKVKNVFSTISLHSGEVSLVSDSHSAILAKSNTRRLSNHISIDGNSHHSGNLLKSNHSHTLSSGSRLLLQRTPTVSKLLRGHSQHRPSRSEFSSKSQGTQTSGSTDNNSVKDTNSGSMLPGGGVRHSVIPAFSSSHTNASVSSLLQNVPENMFGMEKTVDVKSSGASVESESFKDTVESMPLSTKEDEATNTVSPHASSRHRPPRLQIASLSAEISSAPTTANTMSSNSSAPASGLKPTSSDTQPVVYLSSPERSPSPPQNVNAKTRILVAEDNRLNQEIMIKMLHQLGIMNVDTADDGETVIKLVERSIVDGFHYGVIFMDLSMPGMNGIDATYFIRTTLGYPYPIVALTGFSDMKTRNACLSVNIQEVLTKPVMRYDISRVLHQYASLAAASPPLSSTSQHNNIGLVNSPNVEPILMSKRES